MRPCISESVILVFRHVVDCIPSAMPGGYLKAIAISAVSHIPSNLTYMVKPNPIQSIVVLAVEMRSL